MATIRKSKPAPGRPSLPVDQILATALQIIDEEGTEALSMRNLADRLESGTATLYRHFQNRADLITQLIDRMLGEIDFNIENLKTISWQEAYRILAVNFFKVLTKHHRVAPLLAEHLPIGPNAMAQREICISVLLSHGFPPKMAAHAYATLGRFVLGFALQLSSTENLSDQNKKQIEVFFRRLDPKRFPSIAKVAQSLPIPLQDEFDFGLNLILSGLNQLREEKDKRA
ncbi:TetR/AcrR family transcriptional regulator [Leptospira sp. 96542]|nr:TetR/AcrR family transcriptional regulator [Leptospira sp. 96542]